MNQLDSSTWSPILPRAAYALAAAAAGVALAAVLGAPIWVVGSIGLAPWLPLLGAAVALTRRVADGWLALYLALALTQTGHVGEHLVQITQLRVLGLTGEHAHGVFGALDIEWVHFAWNAWVLVAVSLLLFPFRANPWLWLTLPLAAWHLGEHVGTLATYLATGVVNSPGLLARGGSLGGWTSARSTRPPSGLQPGGDVAPAHRAGVAVAPFEYHLTAPAAAITRGLLAAFEDQPAARG